jgi:hypothetical protein
MNDQGIKVDLESLDFMAISTTEKVILSAFRFRMMIPTPQNFLDELLFIIYGDATVPSVRHVKNQTDDLVALFLLNSPSLVSYKFSEVTLASLLTALQILSFFKQV